MGPFRDLHDSFYEILVIQSDFWWSWVLARNNEIMMEFRAPSFPQLLSNYQVDNELYESLRRKPG